MSAYITKQGTLWHSILILYRQPRIHTREIEYMYENVIDIIHIIKLSVQFSFIIEINFIHLRMKHLASV